MLLGELLMVDAIDNRQVGVLARGRDQHPLCSSGQMRGSLVLGREDAGALEGDVDVHGLVRQFRRVLDRRDLEGLPADRDGVALDLHIHVQGAVHAVVFQQVDVGLHRAEIVHRDDLDVLALMFQNGAQDQPTDPAKTVDRYTHCHVRNPYVRSRGDFPRRSAKTMRDRPAPPSCSRGPSLALLIQDFANNSRVECGEIDATRCREP